MELSYSELWILEVGISQDARWILFPMLLDTPHDFEVGLSYQWNVPPNGLSTSEMGQVLWSLYRSGDVSFQSRRFDDDDRNSPPFQPQSPDEIQSILQEEQVFRPLFKREKEHHFCMPTRAGIARWEEYAIPNWSRYRGDFTGQLEQAGETVWTQSATTEEFARYVLDVDAMRLCATRPIVLHWERAEVLRWTPWEPFPGKILPTGVTVSVPATESEFGAFPDDELSAAASTAEERYRRFCEMCDWYERGVATHPGRPRSRILDRKYRTGGAPSD